MFQFYVKPADATQTWLAVLAPPHRAGGIHEGAGFPPGGGSAVHENFSIVTETEAEKKVSGFQASTKKFVHLQFSIIIAY